jgi:hypothetical protein
MLTELVKQVSDQIQTIYFLMLMISAILHLLFAGAVARDAGALYKIGQKPALVSGATWAFATLIGGVITAAIYWFIHHSSFTRPTSRESQYERV